MNELLSVPLLAAPAQIVLIDDARTRTTTPKIFIHFVTRVVPLRAWLFKIASLMTRLTTIDELFKIKCFVKRPFIRFRHILNELFFMLLRIKSITEASVRPYCKRIISKGVRSSHAISMSLDRSASGSGSFRPMQLRSNSNSNSNLHLHLHLHSNLT